MDMNNNTKFSCYSNSLLGIDNNGNKKTINVDIHRYYVDETNNTIFMDTVCNYYPELCKNKYPFQAWGG